MAMRTLICSVFESERVKILGKVGCEKKKLCMRAKSFSAVVEIYDFGILFHRIYVHGRL